MRDTGMAAAVTPARSEAEGTALCLFGDAQRLAIAELLGALARELKQRVYLSAGDEARPEPPSLAVRYVAKSRELAVSYVSVGGRSVTRVAVAPEDPAALERLIVSLGGNLARDEAAELLGPEPSPDSETATAVLAASSPNLPPAPAPSDTPHALQPPRVQQPSRPHHTAVASAFFPLATNAAEPDVHTHLSFNLVYGRVGSLDGGQLGLVNVVTGEVLGLELGVLGSVVTGDLRGIQLGGLGSVVGGRAQALQVGLLGNWSGGGHEGVQVGGAANLSGASTRGIQATFGANLDQGAFDGLQLALLGPNYVGGRVRGIQGALLTNIGTRGVQGLQVAAGLNVAGDVDGAQIGLVNVARRVRGAQIGLVNVAEDVQGAPIGLFSVSRSGGVHGVFWTSTAAYGNAGLKFSTRYTYSQLSLSGHQVGNHNLLGPGLAIGANIPAFERTEVDINTGGTHLFADTECCGAGRFFGAVPRRLDRSQFHLRVGPRYSFHQHFAVFLGAGLIGRLLYPVGEDGDTEAEFKMLPEGFAGIQL